MTNRKIEYYGASWCTACKFVKPIVESLEGIAVEIVDVEQQMDRAAKLGIRNLPTLILLENGEEIKRLSGNKSKKEIEELLTLN
jgi:thioredoxin-like negative regulator of GroEL